MQGSRNAIWIAGGITMAGCRRGQSAPQRAAAARKSEAGADALSYPPGAWWRAELNHVVLPYAHILIRHDHSGQELRLRIPEAKSSRTWDEALRLANSIAERAQAAPKTFDVLAKEYSEDANSRALGGAMGAVPVTYLPAAIVDALGHLQVGEVSHVVFTSAGLHILKRLPAPAEQEIEGRSILIRCNARDFGLVPPRPVVRTCDEAKQLADQVAAKARNQPELFAELAAQYSDDWGGRYGADFGRFSTREVLDDALAVEVLKSLEPAQVSPVIDDPQLGYRIFERTQKRERAQLAFSEFILSSSDVDPSFTRSRAQAKELAARLIETLKTDPGQFEAVRAQHCDYDLCVRSPEAYFQGRGSEPAVDARLHEVPIGAILPEAIETAHGMLIVRREDPAAYPGVAIATPSYVLPQPAPKGLLSASSNEIGWYLEIYTRVATQRFTLAGEDQRSFVAVMDELASALKGATPTERQAFSDAAWKQLETLLGPERTEQLAALNNELILAVQNHRPE
jgi:hypothetical protein